MSQPTRATSHHGARKNYQNRTKSDPKSPKRRLQPAATTTNYQTKCELNSHLHNPQQFLAKCRALDKPRIKTVPRSVTESTTAMLSSRAAALLRTHRPSLHVRRGSQNYQYQHHPPTPPPPITPSAPGGPASAVGLASGALGAMCGVGGAVFVIPGLVRFAQLPQRVAAGNALIAVTCIASTGAYSFASAGCIDTEIAGSLGITAALMTPIGAIVGRRVDAGVLRRALGGFMVVLSPLMPLRGYFEKRQGAGEMSVSAEKKGILAVAGATVGFGSGMLGISGGSMFTPLIATMCPDASFKSVLGTSFAAMIVPTAIGALSYARMGLVTPALVPPLVVGSVVGAGVGSAAALAVPEDVLRWVFAAVFAVLGGRILRAPIKKAPSMDTRNGRRIATT